MAYKLQMHATLKSLHRPSFFKPLQSSSSHACRPARRPTHRFSTRCDTLITPPAKKKPRQPRDKAPPLPQPSSTQQTLKRSFTVGGIGLDTGKYAVIRIRPAPANTGRYFVRVPTGTNAPRFVMEKPNDYTLEQLSPVASGDEDSEDMRVELFQKWLIAQDEDNYQGTFQDFAEEQFGTAEEQFLVAQATEVAARDEPEDAVPVAPSSEDTKVVVKATLEGMQYIVEPFRYSNNSLVDQDDDDFVYREEEEREEIEGLDDDSDEDEDDILHGDMAPRGLLALFNSSKPTSLTATTRIASPLPLLAALEQCGVDNACIEIEGDGDEIPIVDGSAMGWCIETQIVGVTPAVPSASFSSSSTDTIEQQSSSSSSSKGYHKTAPIFTDTIVTYKDDAFIAYHPTTTSGSKITVGVDMSEEAPIIGQQWFTWSPPISDEGNPKAGGGDGHFRWQLSPARACFPSVDALEKLVKGGWLQGGPDYVCLAGDGEKGDRWWNAEIVRFAEDEAARHEATVMLGMMSLLAEAGGRGTPEGHVVMYKADVGLMVEFVKELKRRLDNGEGRYVGI